MPNKSNLLPTRKNKNNLNRENESSIDKNNHQSSKDASSKRKITEVSNNSTISNKRSEVFNVSSNSKKTVSQDLRMEIDEEASCDPPMITNDLVEQILIPLCASHNNDFASRMPSFEYSDDNKSSVLDNDDDSFFNENNKIINERFPENKEDSDNETTYSKKFNKERISGRNILHSSSSSSDSSSHISTIVNPSKRRAIDDKSMKTETDKIEMPIHIQTF